MDKINPADPAPKELSDRFKLVLEMTIDSDLLTEAAKAELRSLIEPQNIAITVSVLVVWAASHAVGIGEIVDIIMVGVGVFMIGWSVFDAAEKLAEFLGLTVQAKTMADLQRASVMLAAVIVILGAKVFKRLITRGAGSITSGGKQGKGKPPKKEDGPPPKKESTSQSSATTQPEAPPKALPPLRQQYVDAVNKLKDKAEAMKSAGKNPEDIARELHADRRALGEKYKALTPPDKLEEIYARNLEKYGDKLGPTIDWLRDRGKTWDQIIESATRTGGKDLGF